MENDRPREPRQFLLRMWPEDLGDGKFEWRGKVQDIATGDSGYFRDWPGLIALILRALEQPLMEAMPQEEPNGPVESRSVEPEL